MAWWSPRALPEILEADENHLSAFLRPLLAQLYEQLRDLDTRIRGEEAQLHAVFKQQKACQCLAAIVAAALGLVLCQHGTGGKVRLLGISNRGNRHLHTLLVHGACSVVQAVMSKDKSDARRRWIKRLVWERGNNRAMVAVAKAMVAVANKNARISWAQLTRQEAYRFATGT